MPLTTGNSVTRGGAMSVRPRDQHGDVEMILEQRGGLDRASRRGRRSATTPSLVEADERNVAAAARRRRRAAPPSSGRPPAASFDQPAVSRMLTKAIVGALARHLGEQRRLLGAADRDRLAALRQPRGTVRARRGRDGARSTTSAPRQPRRIASASSGIVSSQEHTKMVRFSAICLRLCERAGPPPLAWRPTRL